MGAVADAREARTSEVADVASFRVKRPLRVRRLNQMFGPLPRLAFRKALSPAKLN